MVEIKDIVDRESLEAWLDGHTQTIAVSLALRASQRVLPLLLNPVFLRNEEFGPVATMRCLRGLLISEVVARSSSLKNLDIKKIAAAQANALIFKEAFKKKNAMKRGVLEAALFACANTAASANSSIHSAKNSAAAVSSSVAASSEIIWDILRLDCKFSTGERAIGKYGLWLAYEDPFGALWQKSKTQFTNMENQWSFWIKWYEAALKGEPLNYEMLERIALIPSDDWEQGPKHVNGLIAAIEEEFLLAATPQAEKVELNPDTRRLRVVPERMSQKGLYNNILEKIRDGMADLRDSSQFDNALSALAPVFEKVLDRTFDKYLSSPQRVHDDFIKAKRRIQKLLDIGEVAPNDEVIELVEDLDSGAAHIRANMPQVRASMAALAALRIAEASDADIEGLRAGAEAIADLSEPEMAEQMREDAAEIVASRDVPLGAPKVLVPDVTYRLAHRVVASKRILTRENAMRAIKGVRAGFGDTQIVMAIPYAVEILLRLLRM